MSQARRRQIARLEKLAEPKIKQVRQAEEAVENRIEISAKVHAFCLAALILYGNPKQDEPLSDAWQRCIERFPALQPSKADKLVDEWGRLRSRVVANIVAEKVMAELPGTTKKEKFQNLFSSAPPWLIWFTFADLTGAILNLTLPDLSSVTNFRRSKAVFEKWPALPDGKFESCLRSDDLGAEGLSVEDAAFLVDMPKVPEEKMTRLDRKRYHSLFDKLITQSDSKMGGNGGRA
jgi:hypothetical protein